MKIQVGCWDHVLLRLSCLAGYVYALEQMVCLTDYVVGGSSTVRGRNRAPLSYLFQQGSCSPTFACNSAEIVSLFISCQKSV